MSIRKLNQGVDFLGYVILPHYRLLRTKTKHRIYRGLYKRTQEYNQGIIGKRTIKQSLNSYLGVLTHANSYELSEDVKNQALFWLEHKDFSDTP